ncbi:MAG: nucleoside phosphorylase [Robiginitalea sp.]|uniref:nucleoside phosphorylase n=1 Tax=Robiginitalea sp. TaxID=1902411 RepID=UPI003C744AC4
MSLKASELILNADQSVYHLNLHPEDVASTVILVGDPGRVPKVSRHFDHVEVKKSKREFCTHTGTYNGLRISVISTGIGTDNIDIVLNELDALVNIDLRKREVRGTLKTLNLIRLGTSGALQTDIDVDTLVLSDLAIGFDGLLHFYESEKAQEADVQFAFLEYSEWSVFKAIPYVVKASPELCDHLYSRKMIRGFTATTPGFYAPQGRSLRLKPERPNLSQRLSAFRYKDMRITNMEMETAGIFGLAKLMGHKAASVNCILANRMTGTFSADPAAAVDHMIQVTLKNLTRQA